MVVLIEFNLVFPHKSFFYVQKTKGKVKTEEKQTSTPTTTLNGKIKFEEYYTEEYNPVSYLLLCISCFHIYKIHKMAENIHLISVDRRMKLNFANVSMRRTCGPAAKPANLTQKEIKLENYYYFII